jgi:hypothetical protein
MLNQRWSPDVKPSVAAFIKATVTIACKQTDEKQLPDMFAIEKQLVSPRSMKHLMATKHLSKFMPNVFAE